jgi:hypothetical protein
MDDGSVMLLRQRVPCLEGGTVPVGFGVTRLAERYDNRFTPRESVAHT